MGSRYLFNLRHGTSDTGSSAVADFRVAHGGGAGHGSAQPADVLLQRDGVGGADAAHGAEIKERRKRSESNRN